jgi:BASS family bile acid:Na+ symporter
MRLAILILLVVGLGLNVSNIIDLIGSLGLPLGGRDPAVRSVMGLGTAQRNVAAAILVSVQNFSDTNTVSFVLVAAILLLLVLLPTARMLGRRGEPAQPAAAS